MSFQGCISCLPHHLRSQLFRDAARLCLPAQHCFVRVVLLRVDFLQPLPEGLVHCKVELCTGIFCHFLRFFEAFHLIVVQSSGKLQLLAQDSNALCGLLAALYFLIYPHRPWPAQFVQ